ncbi:hypothetical protein [Alishewanella tabrizica]|uniref:SGNH/GDSL hydrolase family protein n=1 Tax=Alishewanella tabrizica TaxID=671278 RepID=A0ABQ2WJP6_9ALTE|nr:hypothetical protein [Alishewanella tabrizica]GGW58661.1 hypothetical protein GCM10008111_13310 [Alishewanella tabrizica]
MKVLILGDSHSMYFSLNNELKQINESFRGVNIKVLSIPGSTILGFGKRSSTLNSRDFFIKELISFKPDFICFALGQVDIELGFFYRKVVKKEDLNIFDYVSMLIAAYLNSVENIQNEFGMPDSSICFKGINISVLTSSREKAVEYTSRIINENIEDSELKLKHHDDLAATYPSNLERYRNHMYFNEVLNGAVKNRYKYFDINDVIKCPNVLGVCRLEFIPSKKDHHLLDSLFMRELYIRRLLSTCLNLL